MCLCVWFLHPPPALAQVFNLINYFMAQWIVVYLVEFHAVSEADVGAFMVLPELVASTLTPRPKPESCGVSLRLPSPSSSWLAWWQTPCSNICRCTLCGSLRASPRTALSAWRCWG